MNEWLIFLRGCDNLRVVNLKDGLGTDFQAHIPGGWMLIWNHPECVR